jgi:small ligand-binding sensory domain FIST
MSGGVIERQFVAAAAEGESWGSVAKACADQLTPLPPGANLGFLYVTDALAADLGSILTFLRERTRIADWVGSVGLGVAATGREYFATPAIATLVAALPEDGFRLFAPGMAGAAAQATAAWLERVRPLIGIVHGDPRDAGIGAAVDALARGQSLYLVGGLAAASEAPVQIAGRVVEGRLSGVLLAPELAVVTGLTQGCSPIGPAHRITAARGNVIEALDDRPALEVFKEDIGESLARDLRRVAGLIFAGFPVTGSDTGDYLVRNLVAIDMKQQLVGVAHEVSPGERVLFCRRDPASAAADLARMLADVKRRTPSPPRAGLYFSCIARGPSLFAEPSRELAMIKDALGDFPLAGFFGNGEIAHDRIYGYTGVLALFL